MSLSCTAPLLLGSILSSGFCLTLTKLLLNVSECFSSLALKGLKTHVLAFFSVPFLNTGVMSARV